METGKCSYHSPVNVRVNQKLACAAYSCLTQTNKFMNFKTLNNAFRERLNEKINLFPGRSPVGKNILRMMKLTVLFMILACLSVSAGGYAQLISLEGKNASIERMLEQIENQSGYRFIYTVDIIEKARPVNVSVKDRPLAEALELCFKDQPLTYSIVEKVIVVKAKEELKPDFYTPGHTKQPDEKQITGKVTDSFGSPLPGVTIVVKSTTRGTITDANGSYSISNVPVDATLVFSFVGMKTQEIDVSGKTSIHVVMVEDAIGIDEVVAIGYGSKTRKEITGSVAQTSGTELRTSPAVNLSNSLAGRLAGVTINQRNGEPGRDDATIYIRGINTTGDNTPLFVIDGIADRDNISRLDPEDIESVTVLKDASAAIYGARAANGVILVTTKRGVEEKPATITYTFNQGFTQPTRLLQMADAGQYAQAWYDAETNTGSSSHLYSLEDIQKFKDGSHPDTHPNTDWIKEVFKKTSHQSRHNISLSGGTNSLRYFLSLGHANQDALYKNSDNGFKQYNFRANIDANITENFKIGFNVSGRKENSQWVGGRTWYIFWLSMRNPPTEHAVFPNGEYSQGIASINPLALIEESGYERVENDIYNGTLSFEYKIPKVTGLTVDGFAAIDNTKYFNKHFMTPWHYSTWDPETDTYERYVSGIISRISLREDFSQDLSVTLNIKLNYAKRFDKHSINGFVAYEQNTGKGDSFWTDRSQFDTRAVDQLFAGTSDKSFFNNSGSGYETARQNYFGRFSYSYADKYLADFNIRYDGSMNFPKGQRFGLFPGLSLGWRISEESFFKSIKLINDLKLRASIGKLGNDRITSFSYLRRFSFGNNYVLGGKDVTGVNETGVAIPDVTWETTITRNLGLDITFLDMKMNMELDVFKNKTTDMLIPRNLAVPDFVGFSPPPQNAGEMENKGFEVTLGYHDRFGQVDFRAGGNIGFSRNKVLYIDETINPDAPWQAQTGHKLNRRLVYDAIGIFRSQADLDTYPHIVGAGLGDLIYRDVNDDDEINGLDMIPTELNEIPEIMFGFNMGLKYKNFDLNVFFQGQARAEQPVCVRFDFSGNADAKQLSDYYSERNPDGSYPRVGLENNYWRGMNSNFWLQSAAFLRLKSVELGYNLPNSISSKIGFKEMRAYVSGFNLFTLSEIKVQDPEITNEFGEGTEHPQTKVFNVGIKVTF